jgi:adenosylhomocysteinase
MADGGTLNMILDDGGDATLLVHLGAQCRISLVGHPTNEEEEVLFASIEAQRNGRAGTQASARTSKASPRRPRPACIGSIRWRRTASSGFRDQRQRQRQQVEIRQPLRLPREPGRWHRRGTDVMMAGKVAMVAGFGDVGKGSAASLARPAAA